jgi:hypothetical protein
MAHGDFPLQKGAEADALLSYFRHHGRIAPICQACSTQRTKAIKTSSSPGE